MSVTITSLTSSIPLFIERILAMAGKWIDGGDTVRAQIALMEVKSMDEKFNE